VAFYGIRFDLRNPEFAGTDMSERYRAAIEMSEWADRLGFMMVVLSEHHGSADGYLPKAMPLASAIAARTKNIRIRIGSIIAPFYDPLHLAEEAAVVDRISDGRLDLVIANGYVPSEFDMFGVPMSERAARTTDMITTLKQAWTGEPFEFRGRTVTVTPTPQQSWEQMLILGGGVQAAAKRAAKHELAFMPTDEGAWEFYREEVQALGRPDPGPYMGGDVSFFHLAEDVEVGWKEIAPYAMHEMNAYGAWMDQAGASGGRGTGYSTTPSEEDLRATGQYRVFTPNQFVELNAAKGPAAYVLCHPLMGGIPPETGWRSLRLLEKEVMPRLP
jgi:alkanesulfonate monooxygenase SsuD/methylene tetrahydromethanopterin reductase-like flavin-dependent oxidoreductase (luciferase family)